MAALSSAFTDEQWSFCVAAIGSLKEHGDARPFLEPVDSVRLGLLHYNNIVRTPMDLSTVERKLISSNPSQPDPIPENPRYLGVEGLIDDVQLIVSNCVLFNGVEGFISYSAWAIEDVFVEQMKSLPGQTEDEKASTLALLLRGKKNKAKALKAADSKTMAGLQAQLDTLQAKMKQLQEKIDSYEE